RRASTELASRGVRGVAIMKVDTEGCEVPILNDLRPMLPDVDFLHVEYHSEDDRRAIEGIVAGDFVLAQARAARPHRGTNSYASRQMISRHPKLDALKISLVA